MLSPSEIRRLEHYGFHALLSSKERRFVCTRGRLHTTADCAGPGSSAQSFTLRTPPRPYRSCPRCRPQAEHLAKTLARVLTIYPAAPPVPNTLHNAFSTATRCVRLRNTIRHIENCTSWQSSLHPAHALESQQVVGRLETELALHQVALSAAAAPLALAIAAAVVSDADHFYWSVGRSQATLQTRRTLHYWCRAVEQGRSPDSRRRMWLRRLGSSPDSLEALKTLEHAYTELTSDRTQFLLVVYGLPDMPCMEALIVPVYRGISPHTDLANREFHAGLCVLPASVAKYMEIFSEGEYRPVPLPDHPHAPEIAAGLWDSESTSSLHSLSELSAATKALIEGTHPVN